MWVKICGITDQETLDALRETPPDAIGLNFYTPSPRYVQPDVARQLVATLPAAVTPVGLFVNSTLAEIETTCTACAITTIQLHGEESPEFLAELQRRQPDWKLIRAFGMGEDGLAEFAGYLESCEKLGVSLWAVLIDARMPGLYGGSGKTIAWKELEKDFNYQQWPPLILAGGLLAENVGTAISQSKPWGVDVASGVEAADGTKDPVKMRKFIAAARAGSFNQQQ